jgi:hypothetical protein
MIQISEERYYDTLVVVVVVVGGGGFWALIALLDVYPSLYCGYLLL